MDAAIDLIAEGRFSEPPLEVLNFPCYLASGFCALPQRWSLADNGDANFPPVRCTAMFEQENALPRSELHFSVDNWDCFARARQDHTNV